MFNLHGYQPACRIVQLWCEVTLLLVCGIQYLGGMKLITSLASLTYSLVELDIFYLNWIPSTRNVARGQMTRVCFIILQKKE